MSTVRYIAARFREPSTYAGLAVLAGIAGYNLDPSMLKTIADAGVAVSALIAMLAADKPAG